MVHRHKWEAILKCQSKTQKKLTRPPFFWLGTPSHVLTRLYPRPNQIRTFQIQLRTPNQITLLYARMCKHLCVCCGFVNCVSAHVVLPHVCFFFFLCLPFLCLSLSPPFNSPPSLLIQHINEGQICTEGGGVVCVRVCMCVAVHG